MPGVLAIVAFLVPLSASLRIRDLQGRAHLSPWVGAEVQGIEGVVTAVVAPGFYLEDSDPDLDPATSEGIRVVGAAGVKTGDRVRVAGVVREARPGCPACAPSDDAYANLTTTEIASTRVEITEHGAALPRPVVVGPIAGERAPPRTIGGGAPIDVESAAAPLDPETRAVDFYESLEGMRIRIEDAVVVGPTRRFSADASELVIVARGGMGAGTRTSRGGLLRRDDDEHPERVFVVGRSDMTLPVLDVGDRFVAPVQGVVDYGFGHFTLVPTNPLPDARPSDAGVPPAFDVPRDAELSAASFNLKNFHLRSEQEKVERLATILAVELHGPDVIALQEVQDDSGPVSDGTTDASQTYAFLTAAIRAVGGPSYAALDVPPSDGQSGGQPGGNIRVGFLLREDRGVTVRRSPLLLGDGASFARSRRPLVVELELRGTPLTAVGVHFVSQLGDGSIFGRFQPASKPSRQTRIEQASVVATFVRERLALDPTARLLVLGDCNDVDSSPPLAVLEEAGLRDLMTAAPLATRYTTIFQGNAEGIDHVLASPALAATLRALAPHHTEVDFAASVTDHDPVVARFDFSSAPDPRRGASWHCAQGRSFRGAWPWGAWWVAWLEAKRRSARRTARLCGTGAAHLRSSRSSMCSAASSSKSPAG
ncbi:MAG TPA: endonuclease/exonuclease/phosphatase family protein [Polyangiaceae bacterium]|nr:endonuclease/exonuclease/phosphatase family protein [Polyangiaceae bacterium]